MNQIMWNPKDKRIQSSHMMAFINFVNQRFNISLENYIQLYKWSIEKTADFWGCFWEYSDIIYHTSYNNVVDDMVSKDTA